jgi:hypothetical protein
MLITPFPNNLIDVGTSMTGPSIKLRVDVPLNVFTPFSSEVFVNLKLVIAWLCGHEPLTIIILTFALKSTSEAISISFI